MYVKRNLILRIAVLALAIPFVFMAGSALATGIDGGYVGTDTCINCHKPAAQGGTASDKTSFVKAGHPYKLRTTKGLTPVASGGDNVTTITDPLSALQLNNTPLCTNITASVKLGSGCRDWPNPGDNPTSYFVANTGTGKLDWSGVQYVVGGFHAKFRWAIKDTHNPCVSPTATDCKTGYIVTGTTQYNMEAALPGNMLSDWSGYNGGTDKGYDCAICHNTNGIMKNNSWNDSGSSTFGNRSQPWTNMGWGSLLTVGTNTLTNAGGFKSEWTLDGVQCEACHGKGSNGTNNGHADGAGNQNVLAIVSSEAAALNTVSIPASAGSYAAALSGNIEICAMCHIRGSNTSGGKEWGAASMNRTLRNGAEMQGNASAENRAFIKHHEQYNEMVGLSTSLTDTNPAHGDGVHASLNCTSCHNPHQRAAQVVPAVADAMGITDNNLTAQERGVVVSCGSCHGAKTVRLAMGSTTCVDCHMGEAVRSAPSAGLMGTWGKKADVKSHIFKISTTATDIVRSASTVTDGAGVLIPVAIAKNTLTVDYACGKCHDSSLAAAQGTQGLGAGVTTAMSRTQAQFFAAGMHVGTAISMSMLNHSASAGTPTTCVSCHTDAGVAGGTVNINPTCTQCHGGDSGATSNGAPRIGNAALASYAQGMHGRPAPATAPTASFTLTPVSGTTVTLTDTSTFDPAATTKKVTVNWGDGVMGVITAGTSTTRTYSAARVRSYPITLAASDGVHPVVKASARVSVPEKLSASGTTLTNARVTLKVDGHVRKVVMSSGTGAFSFLNIPYGRNVVIHVYKYGVASPADWNNGGAPFTATNTGISIL